MEMTLYNFNEAAVSVLNYVIGAFRSDRQVETLGEDQVFAIGKLGFAGKIAPRWRHTLGGYSNVSSVYFSQLSRDRLERLSEKFRLDLEMFDYSPNDYYRYATLVK